MCIYIYIIYIYIYIYISIHIHITYKSVKRAVFNCKFTKSVV